MTFRLMLGKMIVMSSAIFNIHPQLAADSHELFNWKSCQIRLHKNASLPWLIIVPNTDLIEFHDLSLSLQQEVTQLSQVFGNYFKQHCGAEKINFAAIGNVVQQLHIHVIGRHKNDPLWPDVVWGKPLPTASYSEEQVIKIKNTLKKMLEKVT